MSSKTKSKQTIKYDPQALGVYGALQPQIQAGLTNDMTLDPTKSATYNLGLQQLTDAVQALAQKRQNVFLNNLTARGISPSSGFITSQMERMNRATDSAQAQGSIQNFLNFDAMRRNAQAQAMGYRPLQTGSEGEQKTSGLGTWLPQVASAGLQFAGGMMAGGGGQSPYTADVQALPAYTRPSLPVGWAGTPTMPGTNSGSYFQVFPQARPGDYNPFLWRG